MWIGRDNAEHSILLFTGMIDQRVSDAKANDDGDNMKYDQKRSEPRCNGCECLKPCAGIECDCVRGGINECEKYSVAPGECCPSCGK